MADILMETAFFEWLVQSEGGKYLAVLLLSMVPIIELRGAIPLGEVLGLPFIPTFLVSFVGNMIPIPFILLFIRKIFEWMKVHMKRLGGLVQKMEEKAERGGEKIKKYEKWGLFIFVAIPLPGTGGWTGALAAAFLNMKFKDALVSITAGVFSAGVIIGIVTQLVAFLARTIAG